MIRVWPNDGAAWRPDRRTHTETFGACPAGGRRLLPVLAEPRGRPGAPIRSAIPTALIRTEVVSPKGSPPQRYGHVMLTPPTTARGRATVSRIVLAACDLFSKQGVRGTTLDEIGAAAGVGRGQLYHFFADKADLVAEVIAQQVDWVIADMQPDLEAMTTDLDLIAWCDELAADHAQSKDAIRCPIGSLVYELSESDVAARRALKTGFARWEELLTQALHRVAEGGYLNSGADPALLAAGLLAAYQGGMLLANVEGSVAPIRRALEAVLTAAVPASVAPTRNRRGRSQGGSAQRSGQTKPKVSPNAKTPRKSTATPRR